MKRMIAFILVFVISMALCACGISVDNIDIVSLSDGITLLETNTCELNIRFTPKGETAKVKYSSDNEEVAIVDESGVVTAVSVGTANIIASVNKDISDSVTITVIENTAYNRLSGTEKNIVDLLSKVSFQFKNPDSIQVTAVGDTFFQETYSSMYVWISAQNGFGGYALSVYLIAEENGVTEITDVTDIASAIFDPNSSYDIATINEALHEII